jgi:hypothetical protein
MIKEFIILIENFLKKNIGQYNESKLKSRTGLMCYHVK